jgi:small subunit ribosomal protein S3
MGQKTNPIGNRLGIIRGWESNWYGGNDYGDKLAEDDKMETIMVINLPKTIRLESTFMHVYLKLVFQE